MTPEQIKEAYGTYWNHVEHSVDAEGWTYSNEVPHILDFYFEQNTGKEIQFEKSYEGKWRGARWRPKELATLQPHS